jgi:hypothetical protein
MLSILNINKFITFAPLGMVDFEWTIHLRSKFLCLMSWIQETINCLPYIWHLCVNVQVLIEYLLTHRYKFLVHFCSKDLQSLPWNDFMKNHWWKLVLIHIKIGCLHDHYDLYLLASIEWDILSIQTLFVFTQIKIYTFFIFTIMLTPYFNFHVM